MFALIRRNPYAAALSLIFHLVLLTLFFMHKEQVRFMDSAAPIESPQPEETIPVIVEESEIADRLAAAQKRKAQQQQVVIGLKRREAADLQALRKQAEEEKQRLEKLKQQQLEEEELLASEREKRLAEEKKAAEQKKLREEEERRKLAEKKKQEQEAEKQRLAKEKKQKEEAARKQQELAKKIAERDAKVQAAARKSGQTSSTNQKRDGTGTGGTGRKSGGGGGKEYDKYIGLIRSKIKRNWRRPSGTSSGLQVALKVKLFPGGGVADVRVARSSGDPAYDKSAQDAVYAADPLPVPKGKAFDRFRTLNLKFSPTGIR